MNTFLVICSLIVIANTANGQGRLSDDVIKKVCDPSTPDSTLNDLEKCREMIPNEISEIYKACLKELGRGETLKDGMKAHCDDTKVKFQECKKNKIKTLKDDVKAKFMDPKQFEKFNTCIRSTLGLQ